MNSDAHWELKVVRRYFFTAFNGQWTSHLINSFNNYYILFEYKIEYNWKLSKSILLTSTSSSICSCIQLPLSSYNANTEQCAITSLLFCSRHEVQFKAGKAKREMSKNLAYTKLVYSYKMTKYMHKRGSLHMII